LFLQNIKKEDENNSSSRLKKGELNIYIQNNIFILRIIFIFSELQYIYNNILKYKNICIFRISKH